MGLSPVRQKPVQNPLSHKIPSQHHLPVSAQLPRTPRISTAAAEHLFDQLDVGEQTELFGMASIGAPGIAESMFTTAGFTVTERGGTHAVHEFPDADLMWRSLRSPGLMVPALELLGDDGLRAVLMPAIEPFRHSDGSYRLVNELTHVIGQKP